jgi:hypothetical protein
MTASKPLLSLSVVSAGLIARHRAVGFDGAQIAAAGAKPLGFAQYAASAAGQGVTVDVMGTTIAVAGAEITRGAALTLDNQGRVVPAAALAIAAGATGVTSAAANGATALTGGVPPQHVCADALQAAAQAGDLVEILLRR